MKPPLLSLAFWLLASLLMSCGGYDDTRPQLDEMTGIMITDNVPHSTESVDDIIARGDDSSIEDRYDVSNVRIR